MGRLVNGGVGAILGGFLGAYISNTHEIDLSGREDNAIEHGVCDHEAAQSLEKKLTDEFGKSGFTIDVKPPESCERNPAQKANGPQPQ